MRDFWIILLNWREVAELLHDAAHGICAVDDPDHYHADDHARDLRQRATAIFNKRDQEQAIKRLADRAAELGLTKELK